MSVIYSIFALTVVLGIIVVVHEFGHYIAARLTGVRVETFSFGFGKRLFGKQIGDTDFRVSLIPLGGYVKMAGEEEWDPENLKPDEFQAKNRAQKIFILFMGPAMNLLLAFVIFSILNIAGVNEAVYKQEPPVIGYVENNSPAAGAGIRIGDQILTVNGNTVPNWESLEMTIGSNPDENLDVEYLRDGQTYSAKLDVQAAGNYHLGYAGLHNNFFTRVTSITKDSPAETAEVEPDDLIVAVNDQPVNFYQFSEAINSSEGNSLKLKIKRKDDVIEKNMTPTKMFRLESNLIESEKDVEKVLNEAKNSLSQLDFYVGGQRGKYKIVSQDFKTEAEVEKYQKMTDMKFSVGNRWMIGIGYAESIPTKETKYALFPAMGKSMRDIFKLTRLVFDTFKKMILLKLSPKHLSGPIEIAKFSKQAMERGPGNFFLLIAFISLQLGIINLFPIPALDGGHLMIFSIEAILRREFSQKTKGILINAGFLILITLMVFVLLNDVAKTLPNGWSSFLPF